MRSAENNRRAMKIGNTDESYIEAFRRGDQSALDEIVHRYSRRVYFFLLGIIHDANSAQDLTQEVFLRLLRSIKNPFSRVRGMFQPERGSVKTWIFSIARNLAIDYARRKKDIAFSDLDDHTLDALDAASTERRPSLLEDLLDKESGEIMRAAFRILSSDQQQILILHYDEECTFQEIAVILHRSINTVKSIHRRAIVRLQSYLDEYNAHAPK